MYGDFFKAPQPPQGWTGRPPLPPPPPPVRVCAMKAYFDAHKYDPNGGAKCAALVCTCPTCTGRVSL